MTSTRRFSLIGPGRAGMSLHTALIDVGWECAHVFSRDDDVSTAAANADVCVIATPDAAIAEVAAAVAPGQAVVMHLSGATPLVALGAHRTAALHPLVSLVGAESGATVLRETYFAVAGDPIAREIAEQLSGLWFEISDSDRALYHCAAAIASNHTVALLGQVERIAESIGVPFSAFVPLVEASLKNAWELGPAAALTGPAARGDQGTLDAHRAALSELDQGELESYEALMRLAQRLAGKLEDS